VESRGGIAWTLSLDIAQAFMNRRTVSTGDAQFIWTREGVAKPLENGLRESRRRPGESHRQVHLGLCDNRPRMEPSLRPQRWLAWVAAVLVVLTLFYYTQSWLAVGIIASAVAAFFAYQVSRSRQSPKPASAYCLDCGETLSPNARQCTSCGSARWTIKNS
jgi:hypothetical protein